MPTTPSLIRVPEAGGDFTISAVTLNSGPLAGSTAQVIWVRGYPDSPGMVRDFRAVVWRSTPGPTVNALLHRPGAVPESDEVAQPIMASGAAPIIQTKRTRIGTTRGCVAIEPFDLFDRVYFISSPDGKAMSAVTVLGGAAGGVDFHFKMPVGYFCDVDKVSPIGSPPTLTLIKGSGLPEKFAKTATEIGVSAGIPVQSAGTLSVVTVPGGVGVASASEVIS